MYRLLVSTIVLSTAVCAGTTQASLVLVDDFSDKSAGWPSQLTVNFAGTASNAETSLSGVLGGARTRWFGASQVDVTGFDQIVIDIHNAEPHSFFDYRSSAGASATVQLAYGSLAFDGPALNADWSALTHLRVNFSHYDHAGGLPLSVSVGVNSGPGTLSVLGVVITPGAQVFDVPLAGLPAGMLDSVDGVRVEFVAPKGTDFRIESIQVIPEPATLSLLALSGLALIRRRR